MRRIIRNITAVLILLLSGNATASQEIWQGESLLARKASSRASLFLVDDGALRAQLSLAPHESTGDWSHQIQLPMPDGEIVIFSVIESPIVAEELAAKFPGIKTYKVRGMDNSHTFGRIGITPLGFHGMIQTSAGVMYLDPENSSSQPHVYRSRFKGQMPAKKFSCGVHDTQHPTGKSANLSARSANRMQGNLLEYDLAVAATLEYHQFFGSSIVNTISAIAMTIMRVNFVYERDLGVTLRLVADNDDIIETVESGLLDNEDAIVLLGQVESWIDSRLPGDDAAYDIGHMFSAPAFVGGGAAFLGVVCDDDNKANGVTGLPNPGMGDPFDIDFVAHEIGHQFNAEHSFNGTTNICRGSSRNPLTAFEPGSGSTIMAYAGLCGVENIQQYSDATFHAGSIAQIDSFTGGAGNCANSVVVDVDPGPNVKSNRDPTIETISNKVIPANTPFTLDGSATDKDNDPILTQTLSYQWDQMDAGCATDPVTYGTDTGSNALFRSYVPRAESWRNFPALGTQVQGLYDDAEVLPCNNRDLNFRLTVRDGLSGQGSRNVRVSVRNTAGPFEVTNLDVAPPINIPTTFDVTWNVAGTDLAPVNCANVDIDLLTFSDTMAKYSIHSLLADTPNIGMASVTIDPNVNTHPRARVRVKCSDNIFYDVYDTDLAIVGSGTQFSDTDFTIYSNDINGTTGTVAPACGVPVECAPPTAVVSGKKSGGSGAFDYLWLLLMTGIVALVKVYRRYGLQ